MASSIIESTKGGGTALDDTLHGVLVGAGVLAVLTAGVVAMLGRRSPAPATPDPNRPALQP